MGGLTVFKPRNGIEMFLAERAVYFSLQLDRIARAQSAELRLKALTAAQDREERIEKEVAGLASRLFRNARGRTGNANVESPRTQPGDGSPGVFDDADHPLCWFPAWKRAAPAAGWLLERWNELGATLEAGRAWRASDRFKAIRMLRIHQIDALDAPELTAILQACQVLDPRAAISSTACGRISFLPTRRARWINYLRSGCHPAPPADETAARQRLLAIVKRETTRLEKKVKRHQERAELEASLSNDQAGLRRQFPRRDAAGL